MHEYAAVHGAKAQDAGLHPLPQPVPDGTIYTCPMHPEIRQAGPGACPKCGMALEPVMPELGEEENPELASFRRRFRETLPLTVILVAIAMLSHRLHAGPPQAQPWIELALATPVVLWAAWPFFERWPTGALGVYYEAAAAAIASLTLPGQVLGLKARAQTSSAIRALPGLVPKAARHISSAGSEEYIPLTQQGYTGASLFPFHRCPPAPTR